MFQDFKNYLQKKIPGGDGDYLFSAIASESQMISVMSFFGLLLPGILGTLYFLGVPLAQVYYIMCNLYMSQTCILLGLPSWSLLTYNVFPDWRK